MFPKSLALTTTLALAMLMPLTACTSTTQSGAIGGERRQLLLVSSQEVLQMSNQSYQQTIAAARKAGALDRNPAQVARLKRIANRLIPHTAVYRSDATAWDWRVHAISSNEVNAYVLAGGKIIFYTGIIDRLQLSDDEIAAIMGHEMAHALREHSREQISRQVATQSTLGIAAGLLGMSSGQLQAASLLSEVGMNLPHSRTQESEADRLGLELMARAGYNPNAALTLWQKMQKVGGDAPQFLSTHPSSSNRIATMQELIPKVMPLYRSAKK